jgi:acetylornithine deacetylase
MSYVVQHRERLFSILADLVRLPSENSPPGGNEGACQEYIAGFLSKLGWDIDCYQLDDVPGLKQHPLFWPGRNYTNRPNVGARRSGSGGGRSLLLSGHIDTVPKGFAPWIHEPFGAERDGGRLYGRGSMDMKAGIASSLFVAAALRDLRIRLRGDLLIESVVDEEFGGVNGTLAGRLRGFNADAAIIGEPSGLRICPAQRGGRIAHITFSAPGDIFADAQSGCGAVGQLRRFLQALPDFEAIRRRNAPMHEMYAHLQERAPVSVTSISTGPWGASEPIAIPSTCRVELYWQAAPGEAQEAVERDFFEWLRTVFPDPPRVEFPIRWLPGSTIPATAPLVCELRASATEVLGREPLIHGLEAPCDMYVFHQAFATPAVLWGPLGAGAHQPDEYVETESLIQSTEVLLRFVCAWCGTDQPYDFN